MSDNSQRTMTDHAPRPEVAIRPLARGVPAESLEAVFTVEHLNFFYGQFQALHDVSLIIGARQVTALIGPSGCGKTTFLRCLNRLNDLIPDSRVEGLINFVGQDLYAASVRVINIRRRIGMVFQKPNPFPKSIYENVAIAPRLEGKKAGLDDLVEECLRRVALWDEVKDKLRDSAFTLSGGQQQRLCIARTIALRPEVILMDEPASALDPVATIRIEALIAELKTDYTIVVVTHNMQQAARISDHTAFFTVDIQEGSRTGVLVEMGPTRKIFSDPTDRRTDDYISGRFG